MTRWLALLSAVTLTSTGGVGAAMAQAQNGDILVPEFTPGTVVNIRDGGDFTGDPRFATGLTTPVSICQGPGDNIYVAEQATGEVTIITAGGNFTGAAAFATGLELPIALLCSPDQILVSEVLDAEVIDITAGGDFTDAPFFARLDDNLNDLLRDADGTLWACSFNDGVIDITDGGDLRGATYFAPNDFAEDSSLGLAQLGATLLVTNELTSEVLNFTAGGNMSTLPQFALVTEPIGLLGIPQTGQLLAVSEIAMNVAVVHDIAAGGDFTGGVPAFATGIVAFDVAQPVFVAFGCGNGDPDPGEECDDGNTSNTDACVSGCADAECGDGFVRAGMEACDDANEDNTDACLTTCALAICGDGFVRAGMEECDDGNLETGDGCDGECQNETVGGDDGGDDDGADDGADDGPDDGADDGADDGGDDAGGDGGDADGADDGADDGDDGDGGGCSSADHTGGAGALSAILIAALWLYRRRREAGRLG